MLTMPVFFRAIGVFDRLLGNEKKYSVSIAPLNLMGWVKSILFFPLKIVASILLLAGWPVLVFTLWRLDKAFSSLKSSILDIEIGTKSKATRAFALYNSVKKISQRKSDESNLWGVKYVNNIRETAIEYELILRKKLYTELPSEITQTEVDAHREALKGWEDDWDDEEMDAYDIQFNPKFKS